MDVDIYVLYSYEDQEVKDAFGTEEEANNWIKENRKNNEDDIKIDVITVSIDVDKY